MSGNHEPGKGGIAGLAKDVRAKFAELLRAAELTGQRTRLMRSGKPIAYIVSLEDGERLKRFDEMTKQMASPSPYSPSSDPDGMPGIDDPVPELPAMPSAAKMSNPWVDDTPYPDAADEDDRTLAINSFKKVITRIMDENSTVSRPEMLKRIPDDGYIGTAVRKIIGEGGAA